MLCMPEATFVFFSEQTADWHACVPGTSAGSAACLPCRSRKTSKGPDVQLHPAAGSSGQQRS